NQTADQTASNILIGGVNLQGGVPQQLTWFDRNGKRLGVAGLPGTYGRPELSPDGKYVAFERGTPAHIWILDIDRGSITDLTTGPANYGNARWSADGSRILFVSDRDGTPGLYEQAVSSTSMPMKLRQPDGPKSLSDWTRDGKYAVYTVSGLFWALFV